MKSEHRHELKTNELAEWLMNLPGWTKENLRPIIYVSTVLVLAAGWFFYHKYQKNAVLVAKQLEVSGLVTQLTRSKIQVIQSQQAKGFDSSYTLIQAADKLQAASEEANSKESAALALIKSGEAWRSELHYRSGTASEADVKAQIEKAKASYTQAAEKCPTNPSLVAMAQFGLGLCEEEVGDFQKAEQIYRQVSTNPDFQSTVAAVQAKQRLDTMGDYQQKVVFKAPPKQEPNLPQPEAKLNGPGELQPQSVVIKGPDGNLPSQ